MAHLGEYGRHAAQALLALLFQAPLPVTPGLQPQALQAVQTLQQATEVPCLVSHDPHDLQAGKRKAVTQGAERQAERL